MEGHRTSVPADGSAVLSQGTQQSESIDGYWVRLQKQRLVPKEGVTIQLSVIYNNFHTIKVK